MTAPLRLFIVEPSPAAAAAIGATCPPLTTTVPTLEGLGPRGRALSEGNGIAIVIVGPGVDTAAAMALATSLRNGDPRSGVVLIRQRLDTSVLADALRCGVREALAEHDLALLPAAIDRVRHQCERAVRPADAGIHRAFMTTVFSAKGGVGKTTVAVNLAVALAQRGERVVLLDLDLGFGDVAISLGLTPERTLTDAAALGADLDFSALDRILVRHASGVEVLAAPLDPSTAETTPASTVTHCLNALSDRVDHVVIDTPPALDERVLAATDYSDVVALVSSLDVPALKNLRLAMSTLRSIGLSAERQRVVITRSNSHVGVALDEVPAALAHPVSALIPSSSAVPLSINSGVPLLMSTPDHPVSSAIRAFVDDTIPSRHAPPPSPSAQVERRGRSLRRRAWAPSVVTR